MTQVEEPAFPTEAESDPASRKSRVITRAKRGRPFANGNPGRPFGARNKATVLAEALMQGEADALVRTAVEQALAGNIHALHLCLDRLVPLRRERTVAIDLPKVETAADAVQAYAAIAAAVGDGTVTPAESQFLGALVEQQLRAVHAAFLEQRHAEVEREQKAQDDAEARRRADLLIAAGYDERRINRMLSPKLQTPPTVPQD